MSKRNWNKIADEQFDHLDTYYQEDWRNLRERVM